MIKATHYKYTYMLVSRPIKDVKVSYIELIAKPLMFLAKISKVVL